MKTVRQLSKFDPDAHRINWQQIVADLEHRGFSIHTLSHQIDVSSRMLLGWRDGDEPRHDDGERLLRFWAAATGSTRVDLPYQRRKP